MDGSFETVDDLEGKGVLMVKKDKRGEGKVVFIFDMPPLTPRTALKPDRKRSGFGEERPTLMHLLCIGVSRVIATETRITHEAAPHTISTLWLKI